MKQKYELDLLRRLYYLVMDIDTSTTIIEDMQKFAYKNDVELLYEMAMELREILNALMFGECHLEWLSQQKAQEERKA